jgi:hypothetical protein
MSDPISMNNGLGSITSMFFVNGNDKKHKDKTKRLLEPPEYERPVPPEKGIPSRIDFKMNANVLSNFGVVNPATLTGYGYGVQATNSINDNIGLGCEWTIVNFALPNKSVKTAPNPSGPSLKNYSYSRFATWFSPYFEAGFASGIMGIAPYVKAGPDIFYTTTSNYLTDQGGGDTFRGLFDVNLSIGTNVRVFTIKRSRAHCGTIEIKRDMYFNLYLEAGNPTMISSFSSKTGRKPFNFGFGIDFGY